LVSGASGAASICTCCEPGYLALSDRHVPRLASLATLGYLAFMFSRADIIVVFRPALPVAFSRASLLLGLSGDRRVR